MDEAQIEHECSPTIQALLQSSRATSRLGDARLYLHIGWNLGSRKLNNVLLISEETHDQHFVDFFNSLGRKDLKALQLFLSSA